MSKNFTGYNSVIEIETNNNQKYINKTLRLSLPKKKAILIKQLMLQQRLYFDKYNVPISKLINIRLIKQKKNLYNIKSKEVFAGLDFVDIVNKDNLPHYIDQILKDIFVPLLNSTKQEYLDAGIDPIMRNFIYDFKKMQFVYVDFFPPKVKYNGKFIQEIPELTDPDFKKIRNFGHNNRAGIIYALYINLVREYPEFQKIISGKIEQFTYDISQKHLFKYIQTSPMYRIDNKQEVLEIILSIKTWKFLNFYLIREIANWINSKSNQFSSFHKKIYQLTHHITDPNDKEYGKISNKNFKLSLEILQKGLKLIK